MLHVYDLKRGNVQQTITTGSPITSIQWTIINSRFETFWVGLGDGIVSLYYRKVGWRVAQVRTSIRNALKFKLNHPSSLVSRHLFLRFNLQSKVPLRISAHITHTSSPCVLSSPFNRCQYCYSHFKMILPQA